MLEEQEIINEFVVESAEHLADIENELLTIESNGADIDVDLVNKVFRGVHSIKGAAGFIGLSNINRLAHSLESVLNLMRERLLVPESSIVDTMLRSADTLCQMINDVASSDSVEIDHHVLSLTAIADGTAASGPAPAATSAPEISIDPTVDSSPETVQVAVPAQSEPVAPPAVPQPLPAATKPQAAAVKPAAERAARPAKSGADASIRVSVDTIDLLMNLAGELVLSRNQLMQTMANVTGPVDGVVARINQVTSDLQDAIMQTRMQPVGAVFNRFTRVVRDLSSQLGKSCVLEIEGKDVELDKTIIEAIGDPLTHLVRNSIDHGIETEATRVAAGKPAVGNVHLRALHQSGKVRIEIGDDGAGIDPNRLKKKAIERGLLTAESAAAMPDREALRLIFHPGFSTAEKVSDVSGRGVGMDVVRTNIEKLGGIVEVDAEIGRGTTISITLPLTLAIIPSLIVQCDNDRFAIPQVNIVELVSVRKDEQGNRLGRVKDAEVLRLRGELLPLVSLSDTLGSRGALDEERTDSAVNIVVVDTGQLRYGLVVHQLFESEEIVVKPLGQHLKSCPCLCGATILGDGRIALILDVGGIANHQQLRQVAAPEFSGKSGAGSASSSRDDNQMLLVFRNHPLEKFALPMGVVARIERIRADQIDAVGGKHLLQYRGNSLPLLSLEDYTSARPREESDFLFVVVFDVLGQEIGLVTPILEDIREVEMNVDSATLRENGFIGSLVIDEQPTRLVEIFELAQHAEPAWFDRRDKPDETTSRPIRILLAEDSGFFRRQVSKYLRDSGCEIFEAEDGQEAWEMLLGDLAVDGVVTDIEMPRMNGLQLARRIKDHPTLNALPIIALTSLCGEEDRRQGKEAGIDDYQVKMDRERLLQAVLKLIRPLNLSALQTASVS
jgi:two-component system chemotaxis sensor kinase CheA